MRLEPFLDPKRVLVVRATDPAARDRESLLRLIAQTFCDHSPQPLQATPEAILQGFEIREANRSTAMPELGIAFPHALLSGIPMTMLTVVRVIEGVEFTSTPASGKPKRFGSKPIKGDRCDLIFAMIGPDNTPVDHVRLLARLARLLHPPEVRDRLRACIDAASLYAEVLREDQAHVF